MNEEKQAINFNREAFFQPLNLGILFTGILMAFLLSNAGTTAGLILTFIIGIELVYLGVVPRLPRFQQNIKMKKIREKGTAGEEIKVFKQLNPRLKKRFLTLRHLAGLVNQNFEKLPYSSQGLLENIRHKIEELLSNYIALLDLYSRYRTYMNRTIEDELRQEVSILENKLKETSSEPLRAIKERRLRILEKRLQKLSLAQEKFQICTTHLETIEDAVRYIYEQSMTMNNAEEIGFQLDHLLQEVEETSQLIEGLDQDIITVYADSIEDLDSPAPDDGNENAAEPGIYEKGNKAAGKKESDEGDLNGEKDIADRESRIKFKNAK